MKFQLIAFVDPVLEFDLINGDSFARVWVQHFQDELFQILGEIRGYREANLRLFDLGGHSYPIIVVERDLFVHKGKKSDAQSPNVALL